MSSKIWRAPPAPTTPPSRVERAVERLRNWAATRTPCGGCNAVRGATAVIVGKPKR